MSDIVEAFAAVSDQGDDSKTGQFIYDYYSI